MFQRARLKLTIWYVFIATIITFLFSLLAYNGLRLEFEQGLQRQRIFFQQSFLTPDGDPITIFRRTDPQIVQELHRHLIYRILYIDAAIIFTAAVGGYLLAGRTLKPIQKMVDEQNRFVTDASHELRTPLTALRTELEATLLNKKLSSKETRSILESNLEEVIQLQNLSDHLLQLAAHQVSPSTTWTKVSLLSITKEASKKVTPLSNNKKITITNSVEDASILGQKDSLIELFVILLDNAIKYSSSQSSITLASRFKNNRVMITVHDQGIGVQPEDQKKIFDRFFRTDRSRSKSPNKGYGLGLSIAKRIVEDHQGSITVKSRPGQGTIFSILLPVVNQ